MAGQLSSDGLILPHPHRWDVADNLEKITTIAVAGVALYLLATETLDWVPFVVGGVVAALLIAVRWPSGALLGLVIAGSMPRWFVQISAWNARPEHMVVAAFGGILFVRICTRRHSWRALQKLDWLLLGFLAMNYFSSYFTSPDPALTLRWAVLQTLAATPFFLIGQTVRTPEQIDRTLNVWLSVGALEALFGILCYLSYLEFDTRVGLGFFSNLDFIPGVRGSQWEPNIFGSYCATFAGMFLFCFLAREHKKGWYLLGFSLTSVGALLSLARQAWACLIIVIPLVLFYNLRRKSVRWKQFVPLVAVVLISLLVAASAMKDLRERFASLAVSEVMQDPTLIRRARTILQAIDDIKQHPIVGSGSSSFQLMNQGDDDSYEGTGQAWLGSFFFRVAHDTGIIGTVLLGWFFVNLGRRVFKILSVRKSTNTAVGALSAAVIVMFIAYQLTDASTLAFTWIHFGLLAAAVRAAEAGSPASEWRLGTSD
jgi:O-Antigen ligase